MLLVLPVLLPLAATALLLLVPWVRVQRIGALVCALAHLASGVALCFQVQQHRILVLQASSWGPPFGITFVADTLSSLLVLAVGVVGVAVTTYAFAGVDPRREAAGYHPLLMALLAGVSGAFLTGDLFNLYVWFEVMLVASFVLMALHRTQAQLRAAFIYVTLNLLASAILLTALGLLYGQTGSLNMADISARWSETGAPRLQLPLAMLFLTAFGIKAALFPWFFWLPASYHAPPAAIGAVFAGLLTKVGVYSMFRVFTLLFREVPQGVYTLILVISACTMVIGVTCALSQTDYRRVLAFNLVGHIGYTTMGLGLLSVHGIAGSLFYVLHHIVAITNLYLLGGVFLRMRRSTSFHKLGALYRSHPLLSVVAMVPIFALAGVPPFSGFVAKIALIQAAFDARVYWVGAVALVVSLLSVLSMARVWSESFWKPAAEGADHAQPVRAMMLPIGALTLLSIGLSIGAEPVMRMTTHAAEQLLAPRGYLDAVLGRH